MASNTFCVPLSDDGCVDSSQRSIAGNSWQLLPSKSRYAHFSHFKSQGNGAMVRYVRASPLRRPVSIPRHSPGSKAYLFCLRNAVDN
jgi:hypothetical protein